MQALTNGSLSWMCKGAMKVSWRVSHQTFKTLRSNVFPVKSSEGPFIQDWDAGFWMWRFEVTVYICSPDLLMNSKSTHLWFGLFSHIHSKESSRFGRFIHFLQVVRTRTQFILSIPPLATGLLLVSILTCLTQWVFYRWIVLWHRRSWSCTSVENRLQVCGKGVQTSMVFTAFIFTCAAPNKSGKL